MSDATTRNADSLADARARELARLREERAYLRKVAGALAALVDYQNQDQDTCCVYCGVEGAWSDSVRHTPDCPGCARRR